MNLLIIQNGRARRVFTKPLKPGQAGNSQTLAIVAPMVREDARGDLALRQFVESLIAGCAPRDADCEIGKLFEFAQSIRYVEDPIDAERVGDWLTTKTAGQGDCLDKAVLLASMLGAVGYLTRFVCVNFYNDLDRHGFDHIYLEVQRSGGKWQALDPTAEYKPAGWEPPAPVRRVVEIWPSGGNGIGGLLDNILGPLIGTGIQVGGQAAAGAIRQGQLTHEQELALGHQFDAMDDQLAAFAQTLVPFSVISAEQLSAAVQGYQTLAGFAAQYGGISYVASQWAKERPGYDQWLTGLQSKIMGAGTETTGATTAGSVMGQLPATSWLSSPVVLVVALVAVFTVFR